MTNATQQQIESIALLIKGEHAENANGVCRIQHNEEAKKIAQFGYAQVNCSSAYRRQYRIDWVEDGEFHSSGIMKDRHAMRFIDIKFGDFGKKIEAAGFVISEILENLQHNGYTGLYICTCVARGFTPNPENVKNMQRAQVRHTLTDYDSVDKSNMTDYEVRELRRSCSAA